MTKVARETVAVRGEETRRREGRDLDLVLCAISGIDAGAHLWPPRGTDPLRTTACQDFVKSGWIHDL